MSDVKVIRGQLRQIVKEELPGILNEQQYEALRKHVDSRLVEVEKYMKETIDLMNVRQKEILKYLLESYMAALPKKEEEPKSE